MIFGSRRQQCGDQNEDIENNNMRISSSRGKQSNGHESKRSPLKVSAPKGSLKAKTPPRRQKPSQTSAVSPSRKKVSPGVRDEEAKRRSDANRVVYNAECRYRTEMREELSLVVASITSRRSRRQRANYSREEIKYEYGCSYDSSGFVYTFESEGFPGWLSDQEIHHGLKLLLKKLSMKQFADQQIGASSSSLKEPNSTEPSTLNSRMGWAEASEIAAQERNDYGTMNTPHEKKVVQCEDMSSPANETRRVEPEEELPLSNEGAINDDDVIDIQQNKSLETTASASSSESSFLPSAPTIYRDSCQNFADEPPMLHKLQEGDDSITAVSSAGPESSSTSEFNNKNNVGQLPMNNMIQNHSQVYLDLSPSSGSNSESSFGDLTIFSGAERPLTNDEESRISIEREADETCNDGEIEKLLCPGESVSTTEAERYITLGDDLLARGHNQRAISAFEKAMASAFNEMEEVKALIDEAILAETQRLESSSNCGGEMNGLIESDATDAVNVDNPQKTQTELLTPEIIRPQIVLKEKLKQVTHTVMSTYRLLGVAHERNQDYNAAKTAYGDAKEVFRTIILRQSTNLIVSDYSIPTLPALVGGTFNEKDENNLAAQGVKRMEAVMATAEERKQLHQRVQDLQFLLKTSKAKNKLGDKDPSIIKLHREALTELNVLHKTEVQSFGPDHFVPASSMLVKGKIYREIGHYNAAEKEMEQSAQLIRSCLGERHPITADALLMLAGLYHSHGLHLSPRGSSKKEKALEFYKKALCCANNSIGSDGVGQLTDQSIASIKKVKEHIFQLEQELSQADDDQPSLLQQEDQYLRARIKALRNRARSLVSKACNTSIAASERDRLKVRRLALRDLKEILELERTIHDGGADLSETLFQIGKLQLATHEYNLAVQSVQEAIGSFRPMQKRANASKLLDMYLFLANVYETHGNIILHFDGKDKQEIALQMYVEALECLHPSPSEFAGRSPYCLNTLISIYNRIGDICRKMQDFQLTLQIRQRALSLLRRDAILTHFLGDEQINMTMNVLLRVAETHILSQEFSSAVDAYEEALLLHWRSAVLGKCPLENHFSKTGGFDVARLNVSVVLMRLGEVRLLQKQATKSMLYFSPALALLRSSDSKDSNRAEAFVLGRIGYVSLIKRDRIGAVNFLSKALETYRSIGVTDHHDDVIQVRSWLQDAEDGKTDVTLALNLHGTSINEISMKSYFGC